MHKIFCPNCGHPNPIGVHFCANCGYDLTKVKAAAQQSRPSQPSQPKDPRPNPQYNPYQQQPQPPYPPYQQPMPQKRHHGGMIAVIVIVVLLLLGSGYTYMTHTYPFGNGPLGKMIGQSASSRPLLGGGSNSNETSNEDFKANRKLVKTFWGKINNATDSSAANGGSANYSGCFINSSDTHAYKLMKKWVDMTNGEDGVSVASIKPYGFYKINDHDIGYNVRYDYKTEGHHHIQAFKWHTKIYNGKIKSMFNNSKPVYNYDKK